MRICLFLIGFILFQHPVAFLKDDEESKLLSRLDSIDTDTARINFLLQGSKELRAYDPQKSLSYAEKSLELSQKIDFQFGIAESYNNIGIIHNNLGNFDMALDFFMECMPMYEAMNDTPGLASVINSIGRLYYEFEDYENALKYFRICLKLHQQMDDMRGLASAYMNVGSVLANIGEPDSSFIFSSNALEVFLELHDFTKIPSAYLNIGEYYELSENYKMAREYYNRSLSTSKANEVKPRIADSYELLGKSYLKTREYSQARSYLDSALSLASEIQSINRIAVITKCLYEAYSGLGEFKKAISNLELYNLINDSIRDMAINVRLAQLEWDKKRELDMQLKEKELQNARLLRNFAFVAFFLVIITLGVLYRNYRIKRKSNQLLAEIDRLKSHMFSNISHEFRTPLTLILGPLEEMIEEGAEKKPSGKTLRMMERNARQLLSLVNQMLDLSKMDAGQLKLELVEDNIVQALKVMILSFTSLAEKNKINYIWELPEISCNTLFDADKIEKIVNNLLSNAFKFTPGGGSIKVEINLLSENRKKLLPTFTCKSPLMELIVEDTGKGIPEGELNRVFDRFYQVEGGQKTGDIGTGIGLALTRELVELMHGEISVESQVGEGTRFIVNFPLGKEHLKESEYTLIAEKEAVRSTQGILTGTAEAEGIPATDGVKEPDETVYESDQYEDNIPTVLIVEDHADIRGHIRENLKGFRTIEAIDGKKGLDEAIERIPDLVITDLMMPEMDGVELCRRLKTDERTSHIPVIMLTAKAGVEDRIEGLETGADDYITKPFNIKELIVRVKNLIEQRKKLRERFSRNLELGPKDIAVTSADEKFLNRLIERIEINIRDGEFDVAELSTEMALSRMQLYRKIKALTDQTPSEFIRTIRLKRAAQLIKGNFGNISEVCYEVGINHPSYFAKCFKEMYGVLPSEYAKR